MSYIDDTKVIQQYYDETAEKEWLRIENRPEFLLTTRFMDRYIVPGDSVLDIGGGPGRYSLYLAERGCDVTLFDLSFANIDFAQAKAKELGLSLTAIQGDACYVDKVLPGKQFDHVLLMGPMYHLLEEDARISAMNAALKLLKPHGKIFVSFCNLFSGMIFAMAKKPEILTIAKDYPDLRFFLDYRKSLLADESYSGPAFTTAYFIKQSEVLPFMAQFPLEKLHFFGQEGILAPCEQNIFSQEKSVVNAWLDIAEQLCEREELLSYAEHFMYVGRKI